jgi:hypothetical protein
LESGELWIFGNLLESPHDNPHAALVTLFMNAVDEIVDEKEETLSVKTEITQLMKYIPPQPAKRSAGDPWMVNVMSARPLVRDVEKFFKRSEILDVLQGVID